MGTYVIGDIHGCYNEFICLKNKILRSDKDAKLILIGDILDRGPDSYKMIKWCQKNITKDGRFQMILGNHEYEKIYWLEDFFAMIEKRGLSEAKKWIYSDHFDFSFEFLVERNLGEKFFRDLYTFFLSLPLYKRFDIGSKEVMIAHAYVPSEILESDKNFHKYEYLQTKNANGKRIIDRVQESIVWNREIPPERENTIYVVGHTPTISSHAWDFKPGKIFKSGNFYDIDCGITFRGKIPSANLAALRLEDRKEIYLYKE